MLLSNLRTSGIVKRDTVKGKSVYATNCEPLDTPMVVTLLTEFVKNEDVKEELPISDISVSAKVAYYSYDGVTQSPVFLLDKDAEIKVTGFEDSDLGEYTLSDIVLDRAIKPGKYLIYIDDERQAQAPINKYYENNCITFHELHKEDVSWEAHHKAIEGLKKFHSEGKLFLYPLIDFEIVLVRDIKLSGDSSPLALVITKPENINVDFPILFRVYYEIASELEQEINLAYVAESKLYADAALRELANLTQPGEVDAPKLVNSTQPSEVDAPELVNLTRFDCRDEQPSEVDAPKLVNLTRFDCRD